MNEKFSIQGPFLGAPAPNSQNFKNFVFQARVFKISENVGHVSRKSDQSTKFWFGAPFESQGGQKCQNFNNFVFQPRVFKISENVSHVGRKSDQSTKYIYIFFIYTKNTFSEGCQRGLPLESRPPYRAGRQFNGLPVLKTK